MAVEVLQIQQAGGKKEMKVIWGREQQPNLSLNKDFDFGTWKECCSLSERRCYTWAWLKLKHFPKRREGEDGNIYSQ